jgi:hypothetical protein
MLFFTHETKVLNISVDQQNMIYVNPVPHVSSPKADRGRSIFVQSEQSIVRLTCVAALVRVVRLIAACLDQFHVDLMMREWSPCICAILSRMNFGMNCVCRTHTYNT